MKLRLEAWNKFTCQSNNYRQIQLNPHIKKE